MHNNLVASKVSEDRAVENYIKAVGKGLMKIMSKMGISTYMSYCGAQIFEAVGLSEEIVGTYFRGTSSVWEVGIFELAEEMISCIMTLLRSRK